VSRREASVGERAEIQLRGLLGSGAGHGDESAEQAAIEVTMRRELENEQVLGYYEAEEDIARLRVIVKELVKRQSSDLRDNAGGPDETQAIKARFNAFLAHVEEAEATATKLRTELMAATSQSRDLLLVLGELWAEHGPGPPAANR
jgi:hypothetical protein